MKQLIGWKSKIYFIVMPYVVAIPFLSFFTSSLLLHFNNKLCVVEIVKSHSRICGVCTRAMITKSPFANEQQQQQKNAFLSLWLPDRACNHITNILVRHVRDLMVHMAESLSFCANFTGRNIIYIFFFFHIHLFIIWIACSQLELAEILYNICVACIFS